MERATSINITDKEGQSYLKEDVRNKCVDLANEFEELVIGQVLQGKLALSGVTGICFPENSMAIPRNNLTTLKSRPNIFLDSIISCVLADLRLHFSEPDENFLVGKTMEGTSEAVKGGSVRQERIREGGANQFTGVCGDVPTLVVTKTKPTHQWMKHCLK